MDRKFTKIKLNGNWQFKDVEENIWRNATIPGCNYLDLLSDKVIADPFISTNEKDVYWVSEKDWLYKKTFEVTADFLQLQQIELVCERLDTIADLSINGKLVKSVENCHIQYTFDVKKFLIEGQNTIEVLFYSPVKYVKDKQKIERCPNNNNGLNGIPHIRKPQSHFGWDWGPILTPSGISGDIFLLGRNEAKIADVQVLQTHANGSVELAIEGKIENFSNKNQNILVQIEMPNGNILTEQLLATSDFTAKFNILQPELWWVNELSPKEQQPLYKVVVQILSHSNAETNNSNAQKVSDNSAIILDENIKFVGLRTIKLNTSFDKFGKNFQFIINGEPIFAKGANWIPADSFINRVTDKKLEFYLKTARFSNFNMIRVWGGGYYESDEFYNLCDRYGILVWQDFCFACQPYPFFDSDFLRNTLAEVQNNVKRLRHHASLCLWCGNNEIEVMSIAWLNRKKYVDWTQKFFYDILPNELKKHDNITSYIAGTPIGIAHNKGVNSDNVGDTHLWAVWHGLQPLTYYRKRNTRFCSEFGFESLPSLNAINKFATEQDFSLTSSVFNAHQKCNSGNMKMAFYIASNFRLPKQFVDYIYLSGVCQQECIKDATEHWRRNKGECNGSLYWQFNDCWPVCSWASVDYYGGYKALQYGSKKFFNPVAVSVENNKKSLNIFILNDTLDAFKASLAVKLIDFEGKQYFTKTVDCNVLKNCSAKFLQVDVAELKKLANLKECVFVAQLSKNGNVVSEQTVLFDKEKNLNLPVIAPKVAVKLKDDIIEYTINSTAYIRLLQLTTKSDQPFSDNYFDVLPNTPKVVTQQNTEGLTEADILRNLKMFSASEIQPKGSRFGDFALRCKVFLTPLNFFNYIYYKHGATKIKITPDKPNNEK